MNIKQEPNDLFDAPNRLHPVFSAHAC
jgi:hypothetical protein